MILLAFDGIEIEVEGEPWKFEGRGWAYPARIKKLPGNTKSIKSDTFSRMVRAQTLEKQPILGVEMFATYDQGLGRAICILIKERI